MKYTLSFMQVVVAAETGGALGGMVRQLSIDQFENEGRRVSYGTPESATAARKLLDRQMSINSVSKKVIAHLLKPRGWKPPVRRQFFLDCNEIADLCDSAERIFTSEPSVLQIKAPVKIFGDLHGQFGDLMRLFDEYGAPSTAGDIASDPTENDSVEGLRPNARGPGLVTFGVSAILVLGRDLVVVPKLIHPLPPAVSLLETSPEHHIEDTWMQFVTITISFGVSDPFTFFMFHQELNANRPPTPTRGRPQVASDRGSLAWI
ncbi:hypothetical protein BHE74_00008182 [Ensete ventricosum]|nr:hypothetical protein BHE74_00008182 [Ensete ventricosum]